MAVHNWDTPNTIATALSTELNSLASGSKSNQSAAIDNATDKYLFMDVELAVTFGSAPAAGGYVMLLISYSMDGGTNYATDNIIYWPCHLVAFPTNAVTSAQRIVIANLPIGPYHFKLSAHNGASVAFPASGSTVRYRLHNDKVV